MTKDPGVSSLAIDLRKIWDRATLVLAFNR